MSERSDLLEALITHPGWKLYASQIGEEWGPRAYAQKLKAAVQRAREHGKDAGHAIELVDAANDAIADAMRWPGEELGRLKRSEQTHEPSLSRRGGL